jgi:hypothetical protein
VLSLDGMRAHQRLRCAVAQMDNRHAGGEGQPTMVTAATPAQVLLTAHSTEFLSTTASFRIQILLVLAESGIW